MEKRVSLILSNTFNVIFFDVKSFAVRCHPSLGPLSYLNGKKGLYQTTVKKNFTQLFRWKNAIGNSLPVG